MNARAAGARLVYHCRLALSRARRASPGRMVFSRELLLDKQLMAIHTARPVGVGTRLLVKLIKHQTPTINNFIYFIRQGMQTKLRRDLVSALLGIGTCDGKQLLRQLNFYGFEIADLLEAVQEADKTILNTASQGEHSLWTAIQRNRGSSQ